MIAGIVLLILFVLLVAFAVGGIIWVFVHEDLQTKRHIKFIEELEKRSK